MKITLSIKQPSKISCDLQILFVSPSWKEEIAFLGKEVVQLLADVSLLENFTGKDSQTLFIDTPNLAAKRILLYGIGETSVTSIYELQNTLAKAITIAAKARRKRVALSPYHAWTKKFSSETIAQVVSETFFLSTYHFDKYKGVKHHQEKTEIEEFILLTHPSRLSSFEKGVNLGKIYSQATILARDLVNEPANITTPSYLAKVASNLAKEGDIKVTILEKEEMEKLGMNCILGVSQGSDHPPKFIRLVYRSRTPLKKIVIVGKGITFDTGGLSLKPSTGMETMKIDMAGAASVLAVFWGLSQLKPNVEVVGLIAACENMPGGSALHPGDILMAMNGKTVEVLNTDAEGRLTLADVLSYAVLKEKPSSIIDLATLTGACVVALGEKITGLFSNNQNLSKKVQEAALAEGELVWEMPLAKEYKEEIKSSIADLRNISKTRYGGSITAALFLEEFVDDIPWVHLDIAGPAYEEKNTPISPIGGTGFGVRLLLRLLTCY